MTEQEFLDDLQKCINGMIIDVKTVSRCGLTERLEFIKYNVDKYVNDKSFNSLPSINNQESE